MATVSDELLKKMYRQMYTIRQFETQCIKLYRKGLIRGYFHPYLGEEAIAVGVCAALRKEDYIISTHRGHGHCIAKGASVDRMIAELLGKETGYARGRGGSMHIADFETNNLGANGIVGGGVSLGTGAALASKIRDDGRITGIFFSDGGSNEGIFTESLNLGAIWDLPIIMIIENNHYAVSTPVEETSRSNDLYKRAEGYGVPSWPVDGNDVVAVYEKTMEAVKLIHEDRGPVVIEAKTFRHAGHHVNDPGAYMPKEKLDYYRSKDPVDVIGKNYMLEKFSEAEIKNIEKSVDEEIEEAIEFAKRSPEPNVEEFIKEVRGY